MVPAALVVLVLGLVIAGSALIVLQGWFLRNLLMQYGRLLIRVETLEQRPGALEACEPPVHESDCPTEHDRVDSTLLVPLKRSPVYRAVRDRMTDLRPVDSWQEDGFYFFAFALEPAEQSRIDADGPVAIFAMHPASSEPISAAVVAAGPESESISYLRRPDRTCAQLLAGSQGAPDHARSMQSSIARRHNIVRDALAAFGFPPPSSTTEES